MGSVDTSLASAYVTAAFGLGGAIIGGFIAGAVSLVVSRQAREAAERAWVRDSRRDIYDRFLTNAQKLLIACEACKNASPAEDPRRAVETAHLDFFEIYGVVQTVAERPVVDTSRVYAYRLLELKTQLDSQGILGPDSFARVAELVRFARHDTIDAMRSELGLSGSARPPENFNPFRGTNLEDPYEASVRGAIGPGDSLLSKER